MTAGSSACFLAVTVILQSVSAEPALAVMTASPSDLPTTSPDPFTKATSGALLSYVICSEEPDGVTAAVSCVLPPSSMTASVLSKVMSCISVPDTVTVILSFTPSLTDAVMTAVPLPMPYTFPVSSTNATFSSEDDQVTLSAASSGVSFAVS